MEKIALDELPADATQAQKDACKIDLVKGDLRDRDVFSNVFKKYSGDDAIYAVILVAALKAVGESGEIPIESVASLALLPHDHSPASDILFRIPTATTTSTSVDSSTSCAQ